MRDTENLSSSADSIRSTAPFLRELTHEIKTRWCQQLGFQQIGISGTSLDEHEHHLRSWLKKGRHGTMAYMERHDNRRSQPQALLPGTVRVISARMDYLPPSSTAPWRVINDPECGYISRYALGRDYHKLFRKRLQQLCQLIRQALDESALPININTRPFVDSAPVLEKALAQNAGIGWIGKHTNLINQGAGSWFFLGEIYINLPLPIDTPADNRCGSCQSCIDICPTDAIVAPYQLDARRCISYLTIELRDAIPAPLRPLIGNRIYGCDDCQLACPWNRFAQHSREIDFAPRHQLDAPQLTKLFNWSRDEFLKRMEGSAIRRIGYACWLRNIAVALGNGLPTQDASHALNKRLHDDSALVREHVQWALEQLHNKQQPPL